MISLAITAVSPHHVFPLIPPYHSLCYVSLATKYRGEFCEYYGNQASVPYITLIWKHFTSAFSHTSFSCVEENAIHFLTQPHKSQPFTIQWFNSVGSWLMRKALEGTVATCWGGGAPGSYPVPFSTRRPGGTHRCQLSRLELRGQYQWAAGCIDCILVGPYWVLEISDQGAP